LYRGVYRFGCVILSAAHVHHHEVHRDACLPCLACVIRVKIIVDVQHDILAWLRFVLKLFQQECVAPNQQKLLCVRELHILPDRILDVLELAEAEEAVLWRF